MQHTRLHIDGETLKLDVSRLKNADIFIATFVSICFIGCAAVAALIRVGYLGSEIQEQLIILVSVFGIIVTAVTRFMNLASLATKADFASTVAEKVNEVNMGGDARAVMNSLALEQFTGLHDNMWGKFGLSNSKAHIASYLSATRPPGQVAADTTAIDSESRRRLNPDGSNVVLASL